MAAMTMPAGPFAGLASGAAPMATFPNSHLAMPNRGALAAPGRVAWAAKQRGSAIEDLRQAVKEEDWERKYAEGLTKINMKAEWCASAERCSALHFLATSNNGQAKRVLEIGSFCGAGALALAEALPEDGEVLSIELDAWVVEFGKRFRLKSTAGSKIHTCVGSASEELARLAELAGGKGFRPFDLVIVDADKEGMQQYFDLLWSTPGLLSPHAVVCVDMTPFKGQPPLRYEKFGFPHRWQSDSGEQHIKGLREAVKARSDLVGFEFGGMLVTRRSRA